MTVEGWPVVVEYIEYAAAQQGREDKIPAHLWTRSRSLAEHRVTQSAVKARIIERWITVGDWAEVEDG